MRGRCPVVQIVAVVLTVLASAPVTAGPLEDAVATARRGDYPAAARLFRQLADQGNSYAQHSLGAMYAKGVGVPQDYAEAMKWLRLAADKGLAIAQNDMGIMYRQGWGVTRDGAEAVNWFRRAADQDSPYAQNMLGIAYEHGLAVQQSDADALAWYRRAANKVYDSSPLTLMHGPQYNLAAMYASGRGVSKDNVQAYMWFTLAAKLGDLKSPDAPGVALFGASRETALEQRAMVAALMTGAEIAEGERLAREWSPHPVVFIRPQAK